MARRLLSLRDKQKPVESPRTPADYVRHISDGVQKLSGQARDTSVHALEVARLAYSLIVRIETDLGGLDLADDDRESLTGRRERVVSDLHTLYERHQSLLLDQSDQAILGLSEAVQSLAVALSGTEDGSLSARTHGATGLEVTAAAHTKAKTVDGQRRGSSQNCAS